MSPETTSAASLRVPGRAAALILLVVYICSLNYHYTHYAPTEDVPFVFRRGAPSPTNLSHLVFGIVSSSKTLDQRKAYIEAWWRPNVTRGYLFLDKYPDNPSVLCPATCPPVRINDNKDITGWETYPKIDPIQVRQVRSILETFKQHDQDVRWYVMADDDSVLFVDNIVEVLSKYDHTKYFYLGSHGSESILSNAYISFDMGFGGAGFALSYPLMAALEKTLDRCLKRCPYKWTADFHTYFCINALGVALTPQKGFHQIDLHDDLSGLLSSHPQAPLLSLHHINLVDPIFPNMSRHEGIRRLLNPASLDQSRLLQQFICYHHNNNWSVSVSWGYSVQVYESIIARAYLQRPVETFRPWNKKAKFPQFMFNTRSVTNNSCETPHVFFFDTIESLDNAGDPTAMVTTTYARMQPRGLEACFNHSADGISKIRVVSPAKRTLESGRTECCDIAMADDNSTATVTLRPCMEAEEIV